MDKLVETLGITGLSKSQVSVMAKELDTTVEEFRTRPLDAGPYTFVAADALVLKVREAGRVVNVHALIAVGVNAEGYREILGIDVTTAEDGAGWLTFLRSLTARGLSGVRLVTSDAHAGLLSAIGATLPGASWQRCRTHYATNLMAITPKSSWPWVKTLCTVLRRAVTRRVDLVERPASPRRANLRQEAASRGVPRCRGRAGDDTATHRIRYRSPKADRRRDCPLGRPDASYWRQGE